jgi:hypothetical protein
LRLAGRHELDKGGAREVVPAGESTESRCALKVSVRLVGCVGGDIGFDLSLKVIFQLVGECGVGSSEAKMESGNETTPGYDALVPENSARRKTRLLAMETQRLLVRTAPGVVKKYGLITPRMTDPGQNEREWFL